MNHTLVAAVALWSSLGCTQGGDDERPYLEIVGGGFIFNYRLATAEYGFVAKPERRIPPGTIIEAAFEDPAGGPPLVTRQTAKFGRLQYSFRSAPVEGVRADHDYEVTVRLLHPDDGQLLASHTVTFRSDVDQSVLPTAPPVVGPGYQANPAATN